MVPILNNLIQRSNFRRDGPCRYPAHGVMRASGLGRDRRGGREMGPRIGADSYASRFHHSPPSESATDSASEASIDTHRQPAERSKLRFSQQASNYNIGRFGQKDRRPSRVDKLRAHRQNPGGRTKNGGGEDARSDRVGRWETRDDDGPESDAFSSDGHFTTPATSEDDMSISGLDSSTPGVAGSTGARSARTKARNDLIKLFESKGIDLTADDNKDLLDDVDRVLDKRANEIESKKKNGSVDAEAEGRQTVGEMSDMFKNQKRYQKEMMEIQFMKGYHDALMSFAKDCAGSLKIT